MEKRIIEKIRDIQRKEPMSLLDYLFLPSKIWKWLAGFALGFLIRMNNGFIDALLTGSLTAGGIILFLYYRDYKEAYTRYPKELEEKSLLAKIIKLFA